VPLPGRTSTALFWEVEREREGWWGIGWEKSLEEVRRRLSLGRTEGEGGAIPRATEQAALLQQVERLERRICRLERWRSSLEKSELLLDRYRRVFQPPPKLLEEGERDIQKLRELMERRRAEVGVKGVVKKVRRRRRK